ncbi:MAG TPA: helix-turn-helix domain-containing protein [Thermoanaerobaculia bacterium]|nr:helix-turn-helix domain-containing protein [Thermoanaerobaculia bacterium]
MAEPQAADRQQQGQAEEKRYTLSEVSQRTGISMPTLQRYKKLYQNRIPSAGTGRKQRYPEHALPVFEELRRENAGRRGRPRKNASAAPSARSAPSAGSGRRAAAGRRAAPRRKPGRPRKSGLLGGPAKRGPGRPAKRGPGRPPKRGPGRPAATPARGLRGRRLGAGRAGRTGRTPAGRGARAAVGRPALGNGRRRPRVGRPPGRPRGSAQAKGRSQGLLTLTSISQTTGISYPTLVRYVRLYSRRLPHEGKGRARRFHPAAVDVFRELRAQSGRGGRRRGTGARRGRPPGARTGAGVAARRGDTQLGRRVQAIEKTQRSIEKKFNALLKSLQKLSR